MAADQFGERGPGRPAANAQRLDLGRFIRGSAGKQRKRTPAEHAIVLKMPDDAQVAKKRTPNAVWLRRRRLSSGELP